MDNVIRVKYVYNGETRILSVSNDCSFESFCNSLRKSCNQSSRTDCYVSYVDESNDRITVRDTNDLYESISSANAIKLRSTGFPCVKFNVEFKSNPKTTSHREGLSDGLSVTDSQVFIPEELQEGKDAPFEWVKGEAIAATANCVVHSGLRLDTGELMVVKCVYCDPSNTASLRKLEREVNLMKEHQHENIVGYLGAEVKDGHLNIFMEYVPGGSISHLLKRFGRFHERVVRMYTKQILTGLRYLHSRGVLHRDIKGANILVSDRGVVKLADFGCSKKTCDADSLPGSGVGTVLFMAPEIIKDSVYSEQSDLWAVGCTIVEMLTGNPPWGLMMFATPYHAMKHITEMGTPPIPEGVSPECRQFLQQCFQCDASLRGTCEQLLDHAFIVEDCPYVYDTADDHESENFLEYLTAVSESSQSLLEDMKLQAPAKKTQEANQNKNLNPKFRQLLPPSELNSPNSSNLLMTPDRRPPRNQSQSTRNRFAQQTQGKRYYSQRPQHVRTGSNRKHLDVHVHNINGSFLQDKK